MQWSVGISRQLVYAAVNKGVRGLVGPPLWGEWERNLVGELSRSWGVGWMGGCYRRVLVELLRDATGRVVACFGWWAG